MAVPNPIRLPFDPITRAAQLWTRRWGRSSQPVAMASATSIMRVQQLLITDYDAGLEGTDIPTVTMEEVFAFFEANVETVRTVLFRALQAELPSEPLEPGPGLERA